jgi:hypothetical protein
VNSSENSLEPIYLILKPEFFVSDMMLECIGIRTVISGLKLHLVPPIKFKVDVIESIVMAATDDQEWKENYNAVKNGNPRADVEYWHGTFITKNGCGSQQIMIGAK